MPRYIDVYKIRILPLESRVSSDGEVFIPLSSVRMAIQKTPTADVQEVRHGTWRESLSDMFPDGTDYRCSACGRTAILDSEFCPNCGAKMDGEEKHHE